MPWVSRGVLSCCLGPQLVDSSVSEQTPGNFFGVRLVHLHFFLSTPLDFDIQPEPEHKASDLVISSYLFQQSCAVIQSRHVT